MGNGKLPANGDTFEVAFADEGKHLSTEAVNRRDATVKTGTREGRKLNFNHVEPTGSFGGIDKLKFLGEGKSLVGGEMVVERGRSMGIEVILD
jgi:hypothetical protein